MDFFKNHLKEGESLFLNPIALDYDYQPKLIPHREKQQFFLASCIKPLFNNRNGKNIFIHGSPGIGKTVSTKHVLKEIEEESSEIIPIYINCWKKNTAYKIALEICNLLDYKFIHNKTTDELFEIIYKIINKNSTVICLDECDKLTETDIIYNFLESLYRKTIIIIMNEKSWLDKLDSRLRSRLIPEILEFTPYTYEQTFDILKQRISYAFVENTFNEEALKTIAKKTFELKDLRTGLYLLKESGDFAETRSSKKIEIQDVQNAIKKLDNFKIKNSKDLDNEKNEILDLVKNNNGKQSTELYKLYNKDISYKTFRRRLEDLKKAKLINIEEKSKGAKGKSTYVYFGNLKKLNEF
ncbi:MAG: AAA family ATPase [Nanoarchaeota archaeon]|nr:AAA family ATPase [Nanoarchaeota archaeon]